MVSDDEKVGRGKKRQREVEGGEEHSLRVIQAQLGCVNESEQ